MLRAVLLHRKMGQTQWRQLLPGLVFALNTSESKAIKCVPYNVAFGRNAMLPPDILLDHNEHTTPADYSEAKFAQGDVYSQVIGNLQLSKTKIRFNDYKPGEKVWLKTKH